ncbi:uncharacterized protein Pur-alpha isoform X1 [Procambarus clarkii]|uniref:uncharacterized protein Pur-alpha isoform X1 n=1 Tax=Procambarus clarkii TaxID=6728 RepID=UPI0037427A8C
MQDVRGATEDTAAMTAAVQTPARDLLAHTKSPLQELKSEFPPPPTMAQPSPPTEVVQPTSSAEMVQPTPPAEMVQSTPSAEMVQSTPPAQVVQSTSPAEVVQPSPPLIREESSLSHDPSILEYKKQGSPPAAVPEGGVVVAGSQPSDPLQVKAAVRHNGTVKVSPKRETDESPPESGWDPSTRSPPPESHSNPGPPAGQPSHDAPTRSPSHHNPRPPPHTTLPRPVLQDPQMRHPHHQGRPMLHAPSMGPPMHPPPMGPPPRHFARMGHRAPFHGPMVVMPPHQVSPARHPQRPMVSPPRPEHYRTTLAGQTSQDPGDITVPHYQQEPPPGEGPPLQEEAPPYQEGAGYQGEGATGYQGDGATGYQSEGGTGYQGEGATGYQSEGGTGYQGEGATGYQGEGATGYQGEGATGYQGEGATGYQGEGATGYQVRPTRRQPGTLRISKWVNPIPPDPDDGQQQVGEQELATKMLQIQSKRFYIDVKQNRRGRFMKVAEIGADGRRNQVFLALSTAAEFRDHLSLFSDFYANLGPPNPDTLPEDGKLKSETMVKDNRRYYLDLKENSRGRFLRVSLVSQTIARGGPRCQIAIPAQGMIEFRDALQELLDEFGTDDGGYKGELPEGRHMRVENKNFYFDIGQNNRGIYMRISEVKTNFRTAITIPEKSWSRFRDIFADYVDKMKDGGEKGPSESNK